MLRLGKAVEDGADMAIESFMMSFGETVPVLEDACAVPEPLMAVQDDTKSRAESENMVLDGSSASPEVGRLISSKIFISGEGSFSDGWTRESEKFNSPGELLEVECNLYWGPGLFFSEWSVPVLWLWKGGTGGRVLCCWCNVGDDAALEAYNCDLCAGEFEFEFDRLMKDVDVGPAD